ncbi:MAG: diversity-generating retroelement protein Avd [Candidatus Magasanikbacteria bacterium]|nr:diversity-generating retroelement protein Avd [Candidatus Magasanikbacteria bacterium]
MKKTIELYKSYYVYLELFPKKDKHALGATCERYLIQIIELLLEASYLPKDAKRACLLKANNKFEALKVFIRLLHELKILDQKKYIALQSAVQEIGKMFGGWIKSLS